jgi:hypothetical protein
MSESERFAIFNIADSACRFFFGGLIVCGGRVSLRISWQNLPVVVFVSVRISCDLLSSTGNTTVFVLEGVVGFMRVEERAGFFMLEFDDGSIWNSYS